MFYISILCTWTKSEITITELADLSENCSRKGGVSDESAKSVIKRIKTAFSSHTLKTCLLVFMSKNMSSCLKKHVFLSDMQISYKR